MQSALEPLPREMLNDILAAPGRQIGFHVGGQAGLASIEKKDVPAALAYVICPHRREVLATTDGITAGCGCGGTVVEIFRCSHFNEPVLKQSAARCLEKIRGKVPGYTGRTCRECDVPKSPAALQPKQDDRFDADKHLAALPYHPLVRNIAAVTCHYNPQRSQSRVRCYETFARQFPRIGLDLFTAEGSLDDRWEIPGAWRYGLDPDSCLFAKENLLNLAIARLPDRYMRVLWIDADVLMLAPDYVDRLTAELDKHPVAHAFSEILYLGPEGQAHSGWRGSLGLLNSRLDVPTSEPSKGYPGLAWAARRDTLTAIGGLYDRMVTGGGDVGWCVGCWREMRPRHLKMWPESLIQDLHRWAAIAHEHITSVGFAPSRGVHLYHGHLKHRQYTSRNVALRTYAFDPQRDLEYAPNGTLRWSAAAPQALRDAVRKYMLGRKEDEK